MWLPEKTLTHIKLKIMDPRPNLIPTQNGLRSLLPGTTHLFKTSVENQVADLLQEAEDYRSRNSPFEAEQFFAKAASLSDLPEVTSSVRALIWALNGEFQEQQGRLPLALDCYDLATKAAKLDPKSDRVLAYLCHNNQAFLLKALDRVKESETLYVEAANLTEGMTNPVNVVDSAAVHNNLGALYHSTGYFEAAAQLHERAIALLADLTQGREELARSYRMLALAKLFQNDPKAALTALDKLKGTGHASTGRAPERILELLVTEALLRLQCHQTSEATIFAKEAIAYCKDGPRDLAPMLPMLYTNLAAVYCQAGRVQEAADLLQDAHLMLLANLHCTEQDLMLSHRNQLIMAMCNGDTAAVPSHLARLQKLGHEKSFDADRIRSLSPKDLAANLLIYRPQSLMKTGPESLGALPTGLIALKNWLSQGAGIAPTPGHKTMAVPKF